MTTASDMTVEHVLEHPESLVLPKSKHAILAILSSVTDAVLANNTPDRWIQGWQVILEAAKQGYPDIAVYSARTLAQNKPRDAKIPTGVSIFAPVLIKDGMFKGVPK